MLAIIDTETAGLNEKANPLLSIAVLLVDNNLKPVDGFALKLKPPDGTALEVNGAYVNPATMEQVDKYGVNLYIAQKAAEVNGFAVNPPLWLQQALTYQQASNVFSNMLKQYAGTEPVYPLAYNAGFDEKFVRHWLPDLYSKLTLFPESGRFVVNGWYCLLQQYRTVNAGNKYTPTCKLADLSTKSNYAHNKAHEALDDCYAALYGLRWMKTGATYAKS